MADVPDPVVSPGPTSGQVADLKEKIRKYRAGDVLQPEPSYRLPRTALTDTARDADEMTGPYGTVAGLANVFGARPEAAAAVLHGQRDRDIALPNVSGIRDPRLRKATKPVASRKVSR